ncbi:hypothetical protein GCM10022279_10480 [Comamonas faecalis]|uniref:Signal transduction histidine kinase n=1 Tax=Comamonas faecalis TaxID=1387849 RepID=A0ABP7QXG6_9BURK
MQFRTLILALLVVAIAAMATLNWDALNAVGTVSLGVTTVQAPLGLIMLALTVLLGIFFLAYVLAVQGAAVLDARRHAKEMASQRALVDTAEASRFTELRDLLQQQHDSTQQALAGRLDALQAQITQRAQESDNATAAYIGQLEDQLTHKHAG